MGDFAWSFFAIRATMVMRNRSCNERKSNLFYFLYSLFIRVVENHFHDVLGYLRPGKDRSF